MKFVTITTENLLFSNILVVASIIISLFFSSKFKWKILIASIRTFAQLLIVGYFLKYIFDYDTWYTSLGVLLLMHIAAGLICNDSVGLSYKRVDFLFSSFISISIAMAITFILTNIFIISFKPWYRSDYLIPLAGMVIGNSITSVTLYHKNVVSSLQKRKSFVSSLIAMGITGKRAISLFTAEGFLTGLMPTINAMLMIGIVKLPGMMSGQIIGGSSVTQAIYYQIVVMFMITFSSSLTLLIFKFMHASLIFDKKSYYKETIVN